MCVLSVSAKDIKKSCYNRLGDGGHVDHAYGRHIPHSYHEYVDEFNKFVNQYSKTYSSFEEYVRRLSIFAKNYDFVKQHNSDSFTVDINCFADIDSSESNHKGYHVTQKRFGGSKDLCTKADYLVNMSSLPESIDWTQKGAVTSVKNQGSCGSCWAFSTIGSIEGAVQIATGKLIDLSEQELVDCSGSYGNNGCSGGLMEEAFSWVINSNGICSDDDYPYDAKDETCHSCTPAATISACHSVPIDSSQALKAAVSMGPVSVAIEADQMAFQFYSGGVFDSKCGTNLDHGVLVVGYGTDDGKDYWKVKNSWGNSWGENGYIRMARTDDNGAGICGIASDASYPIVDKSMLSDVGVCTGSGYTMSDTKVTLSPNDIKPGDDVVIVFTGNLSTQINSGKVTGAIKMGKIPIYNLDIDLCSQSSCPIKAGNNVTIKIVQLLPSFVPSGEYNGDLTVNDGSGNVVTCVDFDIKIGSNAEIA